MTTRITDTGPDTLVQPTQTAARVTPAPAQPFRSIMWAGARAVVDGAENAVRRLPGGPVLAAAFRPAPTALPINGATLRQPLADSGSPTGERAEGPNGGDPWGAGVPSSADVLGQNAEQNLQYLRLQEQISAESRHYTALSNVLKARHDMVKNAIGNIR